MLKQEFDAWWNGDDLTMDNPFQPLTPAYWAWEGWVAGVKASQAIEQQPDNLNACNHAWFRTGSMKHGEARCIKCGEWKNTEKPANTRLIAAAPDLLEALKRIMGNDCPIVGNPSHAELVEYWQYEKSQGSGEADDRLFALAAIAKATGEKT